MSMDNHISLIHVVAHDNNRCIGKDNSLAWHIPADLQHFKDITSGGVIAMGRKTFVSLGRLLPKRSHHVITHDTDFAHDGVAVHHTLNAAITAAKLDAADRGQSAIYIIGGGEIYAQSLDLADMLHITEVDITIDGDAFYPMLTDNFVCVDSGAWQTDDKSGVKFRFMTYTKK